MLSINRNIELICHIFILIYENHTHIYFYLFIFYFLFGGEKISDWEDAICYIRKRQKNLERVILHL